MRYWIFVRDFLGGFFRRAPRAPFSRVAILNYFEQLGQELYVKKHIAIKDSLYFEKIVQSSAIRCALLQPSMVIVDLGAGSGDLERLIQLHPSSKVVMLDFSPNMLKVCKDLASTDSFAPVIADLENIPLRMQCVDVVFMVNVVPYLDDLERVFRQVHHILRVGGLFALIEPIKNRVWEEEFDGVRIHLRDKTTVLQPLYELGFELLEEEPISFDFVPPFRKLLTTFATFWLFRKHLS